MSVNNSSSNVSREFTIAFCGAIGALTLLAIIVLAFYFCKGKTSSTTLPPGTIVSNSTPNHHMTGGDLSFSESSSTDDQDLSVSVKTSGLNEPSLNGYPKLLYSQVMIEKGDPIASCCSICLGDYKDNDMLRLLPDCYHVFHLNCIDPWLMLHLTCPICRDSLTCMPPDENGPVQATEGKTRSFL